jgi:hypothetical protein
VNRHQPPSGSHSLVCGIAANLTYGHGVVQERNNFILSPPKHMYMGRSMIRRVSGDDQSALPQDFTDLSYNNQPPGDMQTEPLPRPSKLWGRKIRMVRLPALQGSEDGFVSYYSRVRHAED